MNNPIHKCGRQVEQGKTEDWYCPKCNKEYVDQELELQDVVIKTKPGDFGKDNG